MKPSEVSNILRRIATKIDNSKNPKRTFVAEDLRKVIMAVQPLKTIILDASANIGYSDPHPVDDNEEFSEEVERIFHKAGVTHIDWTDDGVELQFSPNSESKVRQVIDGIRAGKLGPELASYFKLMQEMNNDGNPIV
jgi:hypothetical protein